MPIYTVRSIKNGKTLQRKQVTQGLGRDPVVLQAEDDALYLLADTITNTGPEKIAARRDGANLLITLDGSSPTVPDIIIEGYFNHKGGVVAGALTGGGQTAYDLGVLASTGSASTSAAAEAGAVSSAPVQASLPGSGLDGKGWLIAGGLGALALAGAGGGGGGGASGLDKIKAYADDGSKEAPDISDYSKAGVKNVTAANLGAVNSAVDALVSSSVDSKDKVQSVVDAYNRILGEAGSGGGAGVTKPTAGDFLIIGASIGQAQGNVMHLGMLNSVIANLPSSKVDSVDEINGLARAVDKVLAMAAGQAVVLTVEDYATLGLPTDGSGAITNANLAAVNQAVANAGGQAAVDTFPELSGLAVAVATIFNYADDSTQAVPTVAQYTAIGVTGVTETNVAAINSAVAANVGASVDSKGELQSIVDAYVAILAEANGAAADATPNVNPTAAQYGLIGANIGAAATQPMNLSLLNGVVGNLTTQQVDSVAEINAIAAAVDKVIALASGQQVTLTVADYALLGIPTAGQGSVNASNVAAVNAAIAAAGGPSKVDTYPELSSIIAVVAGVVGGDGTQPGPTVAQYAAAGIKGVTEANVDAINNAVITTLGTNLQNTAQVQAVVDAYNVILAEANGAAADATPGLDPTAAQYAAIGANIGSAATSTTGLSLLNDVIGTMTTQQIDTVKEINAIAAAANKVIDAASGQTASLTIADFVLLGIPTAGQGAVTAANLAIVNQAIASSGGATAVDTYAELSGLVGLTAAIYNNASDSSQESATVTQYTNAGIKGVTDLNVAAINDAARLVIGTHAGSKAQIQGIADAYVAILGEANGAAADATPGVDPTVAQYTAIGATLGAAGTNDKILALMNEGLGRLSSTAVDTVAEVNTLAAAANAVFTGAAGGAAPTLAQLSLLGITAVTAANLAAVQAAIAGTADDGSGVSTLAQIQAIVNAVPKEAQVSELLAGEELHLLPLLIGADAFHDGSSSQGLNDVVNPDARISETVILKGGVHALVPLASSLPSLEWHEVLAPAVQALPGPLQGEPSAGSHAMGVVADTPAVSAAVAVAAMPPDELLALGIHPSVLI